MPLVHTLQLDILSLPHEQSVLAFVAALAPQLRALSIRLRLSHNRQYAAALRLLHAE